RGLEPAGVFGVFAVGGFMADRLGIFVLADRRIEPSAGILAPGFSRQRLAPQAELLGQKFRPTLRQVTDGSDPQRVEILLHDSPYARHLADLERRQERLLRAGDYP